MSRAPDWTREEFEILLAGDHLSSSDLVRQLPGRTFDAVEVVRQGIHSFHSGGDIFLLSRMMCERLEDRRGFLTCPVCRASF